MSPAPYGTCADIAAIAEICHARDRPLIVDEAWGAHLPFHDDLPTWAIDAGADVCVVSVHKMGAGFEQGSVFHVQGDLIDVSRLSACADLLMTTSPNVLLYAAIGGWRRQMVKAGRGLLDAALKLAAAPREDVDRMHGLHLLEDKLIAEEASHDLDRLQILIDASELGISGYQAADWLRGHERIDMGLSDHARILATISTADDHSSLHRLVTPLGRLIETATDLPDAKPIKIPATPEFELETVNRPRDASARFEDVKPDDAVRRIAAEQITPYPPGIPVVPGERINKPVLDYLLTALEAGIVLPDPADPSLKTIRVMRH